MNNEKFGKFIAELRKENNMTQKDLASKLKITDKAISKWERGLGFPDIVLLKPLSEIFKVSITELLNGEREKSGKLYGEEKVQELIKIAEKQASKRIKKKIIIWILTMIIAIITFIGLLISKEVLHTYNPIRAAIGFVEIAFFNKDYAVVGNIPTKTIYANSNFDIEKYMNDRGYTKMEGYATKAGIDDFYTNGKEIVLIEHWKMAYEWNKAQPYTEEIENKWKAEMKEREESEKRQEENRNKYPVPLNVEGIDTNANILILPSNMVNSIE